MQQFEYYNYYYFLFIFFTVVIAVIVNFVVVGICHCFCYCCCCCCSCFCCRFIIKYDKIPGTVIQRKKWQSTTCFKPNFYMYYKAFQMACNLIIIIISLNEVNGFKNIFYLDATSSARMIRIDSGVYSYRKMFKL